MLKVTISFKPEWVTQVFLISKPEISCDIFDGDGSHKEKLQGREPGGFAGLLLGYGGNTGFRSRC